MSTTSSPSDAVWYAPRRTMPPHSFATNLAELIQQLPRYHVDEAIVMVEAEDLSHGLMPVAQFEPYVPRPMQTRSELDKLGIRYSLNAWGTHGHTDRARDASEALPGVHTFVGHDGSSSIGCVCSLDPQWRQWVCDLWMLLARTEPHVFWIEDDIRLFNHGPVRYGCFRDLHVRQFSNVIGQDVTRQQLVYALLQPDKPHPWRSVWLDLQGRNMIEVAAMMVQAVHQVGPDTHMGPMSSGPRDHRVEGRRWIEFCEALGGAKTIYSRAPLGNYDEQTLHGLYFSHDSIKLTRHVTLSGTIELTEVENVPFTCYGNSTAFTFLKMAICTRSASTNLCASINLRLYTLHGVEP